MSCNTVCIWYMRRTQPEGDVYVCNCNGIREREARAAIAAGASKPAEIFHRCQSVPRCAKCVCDLRRMIQDSDQALRYAAE